MADSLKERVEAIDWYHTFDLPGGIVTKGFFDLRPVVHHYGIPDRLDGKRALDAGTFDGFLAFEMERRGAEVVGVDVPSVDNLDFPAPLKRRGRQREFEVRRPAFDVAKEALGCNARREFVSVYEVDPEKLGMFDLVMVGSLLVHLRDPVGALMALYRVCRGRIIIVEEVDRRLDLISRKRGLARFQAISPHLTWWIANRACWAQMLEAAGFVNVQHGPTFMLPFYGKKGGVRHAVLSASVLDAER